MYSGTSEQDLFPATVAKAAGECVEQTEERTLSAHGDRDVVGTEIPAKLALKEFGDCSSEIRTAGGRFVIAQHMFEFAGRGHDLVHTLAPECIDFRNVCGLSAAEHVHLLAAACQSMAEVFHQLANAAAAAKALAKFRPFRGICRMISW